MAEWSIAAVLKTAVPQGTGGSNPSLSAETQAERPGFFISMYFYGVCSGAGLFFVRWISSAIFK